MQTASIISIGDELLYGATLDTNAHHISQELSNLGLVIKERKTIADNFQEMHEAFREANDLVDLVIITGGLGPTEDDLTKSVLANFFDCPLVENESVLEDLKEMFARRERKLTATNREQATIPEKAEALRNVEGTAPGMWLKSKAIFVSLPGVPREMKSLMEREVIPRVKKAFSLAPIQHYYISTVGIGESYLSDKIQPWVEALPNHYKLAFLPNSGQVLLRVTALGVSESDFLTEIKKYKGLLEDLAGEYIFSYQKDSLEESLGKLLLAKSKTIATAESCTGGNVAHLLTSISGSSAYFQGGIVAYQNSIKENLLGVSSETLEKHGAVSEQVVREMAEQVRQKYDADIGISTSGIAGPTGGSDEKPIGTVWIAYSDSEKTVTKLLKLTKNRSHNIELASISVMDLVRKQLN